MENYKEASKKCLFDQKTYDMPEILVSSENKDVSKSHFENHTLIELLLSSLNYKSVEITLINGVTVRGVLEYRKVMLDKIQYKSINYKKLKIVILRDCAFSQRNAESPARSFKIESVFIPLRAISSLTSPEIDDPLKHLRSYLKKSILNI